MKVSVGVNFLKQGAFDVQSIVSIPHAKFVRKLGSLADKQMAQVVDALEFWLNLN